MAFSKNMILSWRSLAIVLLVLVIVYLMILSTRCSVSSSYISKLQHRLKRVLLQLKDFKERHKNMSEEIKRRKNINFIEEDMTPIQEYENVKRRIFSNTKELWYYVSHQLENMTSGNHKPNQIRFLLQEAAGRKRSLLSDQEKLPAVDGYKKWRCNEAASVSDLVQRRLRYLQNPLDCSNARKLVCNLNKNFCGFGCHIHHVVYCLIFAYETERTLILNSEEWSYYKNGWGHVFHPLSNTCTSVFSDKVLPWPASKNIKVISIPILELIPQKLEFLPLAIPKDIGHRIVQFNGDPSSWWIGQMLKYILKPQTSLQKAINDTIARISLKSPIVGVHVRRSDKVGIEAAFHDIDEYMSHVDEFYAQLELTRAVDERRVYIATDDASVLDEARTRYPQYTFYGDPSIAKTAATHRRYTPLSLTGLLVDLHMLSLCDYIVCTFSSQFGRVVYEMMQANRVDASGSYVSLDDIYHFVGQNPHNRIVVVPSGNRNNTMYEMDDQIDVSDSYWTGYTNKGTNKTGHIPWYKTMDQLELHPFPEYKQVPISEAQMKP